MKDRRKSKKKRRGMLVLYLVVCTAVIVIAYFHLTKIAKDYNTEHLELISGLYAEKMNETIDYLQSYAKENVKTVRNPRRGSGHPSGRGKGLRPDSGADPRDCKI